MTLWLSQGNLLQCKLLPYWQSDDRSLSCGGVSDMAAHQVVGAVAGVKE